MYFHLLAPPDQSTGAFGTSTDRPDRLQSLGSGRRIGAALVDHRVGHGRAELSRATGDPQGPRYRGGEIRGRRIVREGF